jgi:hypothetical protein
MNGVGTPAVTMQREQAIRAAKQWTSADGAQTRGHDARNPTRRHARQ